MRDTGPLQLGSVARRDYFGGRLDEVQLWKRALSRAEVEPNMKQTLTGTESGLVAYYDFEELDAYCMVPTVRVMVIGSICAMAPGLPTKK